MIIFGHRDSMWGAAVEVLKAEGDDKGSLEHLGG